MGETKEDNQKLRREFFKTKPKRMDKATEEIETETKRIEALPREKIFRELGDGAARKLLLSILILEREMISAKNSRTRTNAAIEMIRLLKEMGILKHFIPPFGLNVPGLTKQAPREKYEFGDKKKGLKRRIQEGAQNSEKGDGD